MQTILPFKKEELLDIRIKKFNKLNHELNDLYMKKLELIRKYNDEIEEIDVLLDKEYKKSNEVKRK